MIRSLRKGLLHLVCTRIVQNHDERKDNLSAYSCPLMHQQDRFPAISLGINAPVNTINLSNLLVTFAGFVTLYSML